MRTKVLLASSFQARTGSGFVEYSPPIRVCRSHLGNACGRLIANLALIVLTTGAGIAEEATFHSSRDARRWLARELPRVTLANPKYRSKSDETVSQWLTKAIRFSRDREGHVHAVMEESYTQTKAGIVTPGEHSAAFSLAEVEISDLTEPDDLTPTGEPARGVLFTCKKPGCIAANWSGHASRGDKTDISIQDDMLRAKVLAAFRLLSARPG